MQWLMRMLTLLALLGAVACVGTDDGDRDLDDDDDEPDGGDTDDGTSGDTDSGSETESESDPDCVPEGFTGVSSSGDYCCPGLDQIKADSPSEGICIEVGGVFFCTNCGNGECVEPENWCNCDEDCQP